MKKKVSKLLLTRISFENSYIRERLQGKKASIIDCPLIEYEMISDDWSELANSDYIIITSKFLAQNMPDNTWSAKILVVGGVSASILQDKGYEVALTAGSALQIKEYLLEKKLSDKKILYLSGDYITTPMPDFVKQVVVYNVHYLQELTDAQIKVFRAYIDYIMLYSENCGKTLLDLIAKYNLQPYLKNTIIVSMSKKLPAVLKPFFAKVIVKQSNEEMISYLKANL